MKKISMLAFALFMLTISFAQPKVIEKAIVKVKTEMTFPENFGNGGGPGGGGGGGGEVVTMGMPRDMETNTTMYYTPDFMKVESMSDFGNNVVITDRKNKKTTTLIEAMGRKTGFYSTDADAEAMKAKTDSMRQLKRDSLQSALGITFKDNKPELVYTEETKKISGVNCKKVIIKSKGQNGAVTENIVWYNPEFKMATTSTAAGNTGGGFGGGRGMMSMAGGIPGLELIEGFPMEYEMVRGNGFKIHMTVTKVQPDASIDEKIFEIPKGFDLKPMSSMQGGEGMRTMIFRNREN